MKSKTVISLFSSITMVAVACSNQPSSSGEKKTQPTTSTSPAIGTQNAQPSTTSTDCTSLWALAVKQQPVNKVFTYDSAIQSSALTKSGIARTDTVISNDGTKITRKIVVNDALVTQLLPGLSSQTVVVAKDQFITGCQGALAGQATKLTILGGEAALKAPVVESITVAGQTLSAKRYDGTLSNVTLGSVTISSAEVTIYFSDSYPALPLKQAVKITSSSLTLLNGTTITDLIKVIPTSTP